MHPPRNVPTLVSAEECRGISPKAVAAAVAVVLLTNWWMYHSELVTGRYVTQGVPPVPALIALILGVVLQPAVRRICPRLAFNRAELLTMFMLATIAIPLTSAYGVRAFLPHLTASFYRAGPENHFADLNQHIPTWYAPHDPEVVRQVFEGLDDGQSVPWENWVGPLCLWALFLLICFVGAISFLCLMHREWSEGERLMYPLTFVPLEMTRATEDGQRPLFADPLAWVGIAISCAFNLWNILGAFNPSIPSPKFYVDLSGLFTEQPWSWIRPITLFHRPDVVGLSYLIPTEILLSTWLFYFVSRLVRMAGYALGQQAPMFPYPMEQGTGGYIAMALVLLWSGRRSLCRAVSALRGQGDDAAAGRDPLPPRMALTGLAVSAIGFLAWCRVSGMSLMVAAPYLVILALFLVVYARFRAETGAPIEFLYPYGYGRRVLMYTIGVDRLIRLGGPQGLTILTSLAWLARHHLVPSATAYSADSLHMGDAVGLKLRRLVPVIVAIFLLGLAVAFFVHLSAYYTYGQNVLEGRTFESDYRAQVALAEFADLDTMLQAPAGPDRDLTRYTVVGFGVVMVLSLLRRSLMRFPLHPMGFILSVCYGMDNPWWFAVFLAWAAKELALKLGGLPLYRRLVPLFLGIYLGHLFAGGVVWPTLSIFIDYTISARYHIYFG